jgi:hypothetical protein
MAEIGPCSGLRPHTAPASIKRHTEDFFSFCPFFKQNVTNEYVDFFFKFDPFEGPEMATRGG